jgi:hypothetical protein
MHHGFPQRGPQLADFPEFMGHSPDILAGEVRL